MSAPVFDPLAFRTNEQVVGIGLLSNLPWTAVRVSIHDDHTIGKQPEICLDHEHATAQKHQSYLNIYKNIRLKEHVA